jgi:hypothetical protein
LGCTVQPIQPAYASTSAMPNIESRDKQPKRFRVAFSFAGEKRKFVAKVARILADRFGEDKILYDKFHEAEFARYDLGIYLPKLYGEQSELIVPVICPNYDQKRWTGWEWVHIYGLLTKSDGHRVMPCRFKRAKADGLTPAAGFVELDDKSPETTATLILERLALNEGKPKGHYTKSIGASSDTHSTSVARNLPRSNAQDPQSSRDNMARRHAGPIRTAKSPGQVCKPFTGCTVSGSANILDPF